MILSLFQGFAQNDSVKANNKNMEKFLLEDYKNFTQDKSFSDSIYGIDGTYRYRDEILRIAVNNENIVLNKGNINDHYEDLKYYSVTNNQLIYSGKLFDRIKYGIWLKYDEQGNLIEKINQDEHFEFTVQNLIEKMQKEYGVDISKKSISSVRRYYKKEYDISFYSVIVRPFSGAAQHHGYIIDGNTGKTLLHAGRSRGDGLESVLDTFLQSFKKK